MVNYFFIIICRCTSVSFISINFLFFSLLCFPLHFFLSLFFFTNFLTISFSFFASVSYQCSVSNNFFMHGSPYPAVFSLFSPAGLLCLPFGGLRIPVEVDLIRIRSMRELRIHIRIDRYYNLKNFKWIRPENNHNFLSISDLFC